MEIRLAGPQDATALCEVVRRSITELCIADHKNDPEILSRWLENKTPENVIQWLANPDATILVAIELDAVLAAGCVTRAGEIVLNYVSPDARFRGVSRALLHALEETAQRNGNSVCRLDSTMTALRFYGGAGYVQAGEPIRKFGLEGYPMMKPLPPA